MAIPDLRGRHVLITGGAAGIGLETALGFARLGAHLILTDLKKADLDAAAKQVRALGVDCRTWVADVADEAAMRTLADEVHAAVGALDVLVNNAGIGFVGAFVNTPMDTWRRVLDVNVMGVVHGCAFFLPRMLDAGGARHVVNVASAAGLGPVGNLSAYVASKHAVVGLSDTMSIELAGTPVGVTVVCPGIINTAIVQVSAAGTQVGKGITREQVEHIGQYYAAHGCHPKVVADQIVDAVRTGKGLITPGPTATSSYYARRLLPRRVHLKLCADASRKAGYLR